MKAVNAIFIHGVGTQERGYSSSAQLWLARALAARGRQLYAREVLWSPILDRYENEMMREIRARGSAVRPAQRLVVGTLADALCYGNRREEILELVDRAFASLRSSSCYVFAHSLGGVIATDWLRTRAGAKIDRLITFGCNLQLFSLGAKEAWKCPPQVSARGKWVSAFDEDDMLGYPLAGWQPHVIDVEVSVGGLLGGTGLAHTAYFTDEGFWRETVPQLLV